MAAQNEAVGHDTEVRSPSPGPVTFRLLVNGTGVAGRTLAQARPGVPAAPATGRTAAMAASAMTIPVGAFRMRDVNTKLAS
jgi:hypothetical protein